jgi:chromosome segregation ATPase
VHLRTLRIRGFKSFPDRSRSRSSRRRGHRRPNGSGKSNIADAIVWAAGR